MSCPNQCYLIGGPWIAEDPSCPIHGVDAQNEAMARDSEKEDMEIRVQTLENLVSDLLERVASLEGGDNR